MARMTIRPGKDMILKVSKLEAQFDDIAKKAIYAGIAVVGNKVKANLIEVLSGEGSGELVESFGSTVIQKGIRGNWNAKLGFDGYDTVTGVANSIKARVLESGSSKQDKRPYVEPAIRATRHRCVETMNHIIEVEIKKITE